MDDLKDDRQIVGQPDSMVHEPVTLSDLEFAKSFLNRAELVSGDVASKIKDVVEALNKRSEEESFRNGREIL